MHFAWHGDKRGRFKDSLYSELMWVQAKKFVFLGAGAIGSTEILLRSRVHGLEVSSMVGKNMSGNGDMLGFGYHGNDIANAIGKEDPEYLKQHPVGPTINGIIDMRHPETTPNVLDGYVIEEGAIPEALAGVMQDMFDISPKSSPRLRSIGACIREVKDGLLNRLAGPWDYGSSLNRTMVYLIMSHDDNQATLILKHDKPYLQYRGASKAETVKKLTARLEEATSHMGAQFVNNPFMAKFLGKSEITVHPLGGANMSSDGTGANGVTNHYGEVFKGHGADVHEGLIVVDGAIIPTALAVNPFATITALAERSVAGIARANGIAINYDLDNCISPHTSILISGEIDWSKPKVSWKLDHDMERAQTQIAKSPQVGGVRFTEIMQGYVHIGGDILDPETAAEVAKGASSRAKFYLSVDVWDVDGLKIKNNHAAMLTGTFSCGALSPDPLMVLGGSFQLFSQDPSAPDTQNLVYDFDMRTVCHSYYLSNFRLVEQYTISMEKRRLILLFHCPCTIAGRRLQLSMSPSLTQNPLSIADVKTILSASVFSTSTRKISQRSCSLSGQLENQLSKKWSASRNSCHILQDVSPNHSSLRSTSCNIRSQTKLDSITKSIRQSQSL